MNIVFSNVISESDQVHKLTRFIECINLNYSKNGVFMYNVMNIAYSYNEKYNSSNTTIGIWKVKQFKDG